MRSEIEISSFYPPGVRFSDNMFRRGDMLSVTLPIVGIITRYRESGKFFRQQRAAFVRPSAVVPCEYYAGISFNCVPSPPLILFPADITP